ncbi:MAG: ADOP family duplicated permease [Gemmatimonadaceae bacterium]
MTREPRIPGLRRAFRLPAGAPRSVEREVEDELRFHVESRVEALVASGMSPASARERALREFGSIEDARRELAAIDRRRLGRAGRLARAEAVFRDLRHAARGLRREPGLALAVILTMALGIGANAVMFGVVDRLLLSPAAHLTGVESLSRLYLRYASSYFGDITAPVTNYATFRDLSQARAFGLVAAASNAIEQPLGRGAAARPTKVVQASASFFPLLGVRPALGRFFGPAEDLAPTGAAVAVLSHGLWRRAFGGDPGVVGRTITLDGQPVTVVGVAPRGFTGADLAPVDVWVPLTYALYREQGDRYVADRLAFNIPVYARLRPGVTRARAEAEATAIVRRGYDALPADRRPGSSPSSVRLASIIGARASAEMRASSGPADTASIARVSLWLLGVAGVVLLVACANVAGLLLGRSVRRRRETAVRLALGVGHGRLLAALMAEGVLLALLGGAGALAIAAWGGAAARARLLPDVEWGAAVDVRVLAVTAAIALVVGVACSLAPALQARRTDLAAALKATAREGTYRSAPLRGALLVGQAALLALLLVGAGLFVRSLRNARNEPLGLDLDHLLLVQPNLSHLPDSAVRRRAVWEGALERVRALPGVEHAALSTATPFNMALAGWLRPAGAPPPKPTDAAPFYADATPDFFATLGASLARGRTFAPGEKGVVINETLARQFWPKGGDVGACVTIGEAKTCVPVLGVVRDVRVFRIREEPHAFFYVPLREAVNARALLVRTAADPATLVPAVRRAVQAVEPGAVYVSVVPLRVFVDPQLRPWRLGAAVFTAFGGLALVLAVVGLYGALAYAVAQRRQEIGVRMALGAEPRTLAGMVAWQGVRPAAIGLAVGLVASLALGRFAAPLLFDVAPADPIVLGAVAAVILGVAAAGSAVPAWRATRVDPAEVLRTD